MMNKRDALSRQRIKVFSTLKCCILQLRDVAGERFSIKLLANKLIIAVINPPVSGHIDLAICKKQARDQRDVGICSELQKFSAYVYTRHTLKKTSKNHNTA